MQVIGRSNATQRKSHQHYSQRIFLTCADSLDDKPVGRINMQCHQTLHKFLSSRRESKLVQLRLGELHRGGFLKSASAPIPDAHFSFCSKRRRIQNAALEKRVTHHFGIIKDLDTFCNGFRKEGWHRYFQLQPRSLGFPDS